MSIMLRSRALFHVFGVIVSLVAVASAQSSSPLTVNTLAYTALPNSARYPSVPSSNNFFNNRMDFTSIDNRIIIGAADQLVLLDYDLNLIDKFTWSNDSSIECRSDNTEDDCRNYIRVYDEIPGGVDGSRALLVCGTQSVNPQCRTLPITNDSLFGSAGAASSSVEGLISPYPHLPNFGEFRGSSQSDMTYFSASFTGSTTSSYEMAYISINTSTNSPVPQREHGIVQEWLSSPVVFVDFRRENYPPPPGLTDEAAYQFYFVFLREKADNRQLYSRVIRICRNDAGAASTQEPGSQIFSTYFTARIFCVRDIPPGNQFIGAQDFEYNEIWSVSFNSASGGRYYSGGEHNRFMYGAFSGPIIGPRGTAICVYPASPNAAPPNENGIFDVFFGDLLITNMTGNNNERQNMFMQCTPGSGSERGDPEDIQIIKDISQIGDNPLVILDGVHVTQMVVDEVCVVRVDGETCVNQDILWLGTNNGLVYKVIIVSDGNGDTTPLIVDEISLDHMSSVQGMRIEVVGSTKQLFVSTGTRVYRLPLENCAQYGSNFTECIAARDPYCVWDSGAAGCTRNTLSAAAGAVESIPSSVRQNVHTGIDTVPVVRFSESGYAVQEDSGPLEVTIISDSRVSDGVLQLVLIPGTARGGLNFEDRPDPTVNFPANSNTVTVSIGIISSPEVFSGNLEFTMSLRSSGAGALSSPNSNVTVTIVDTQALYFQLTLGGLGQQTCEQWRLFDPAEKMSAITSGILSGALGVKPEDNTDVFLSSTFLCANKLSTDKQEFVVFRLILDLTKLFPSLSRLQALRLLSNWVAKTPRIQDGQTLYNVLYDTSCSLEITSINADLCEYNGITVGDTGAVSSPSDVGATTALGVLLAVSIIISLLIIAMVGAYTLYHRNRKSYCHNTVGVNKTDNGSEVAGNGNHDSPPNTAAQLVHFQFPPDTIDTSSDTKHTSPDSPV